MLRVTASRNAKEYFAQSLKREDYYSEGQEVSGDWNGMVAERLGLSGAVTQADFESLCDNKIPGTDERLTQRNKTNRTVGYDFNFHCPKSVSVAYEFTHDERILDAFKSSVNQTMREIESEIKTRVRKSGIINRGFALEVHNADAVETRVENGQTNGYVFFNSNLSEKQIQLLQQETEKQTQTTKGKAK